MRAYTETTFIPVKMYRSADHLTVAAPMPGLQPQDIAVRITSSGWLQLRGDIRGDLKDVKNVLLNEWSVGGYYRELELPNAVNGELTNVTYDNGVLVVAMPISQEFSPIELTLETTGRARGKWVGHSGHVAQEETLPDDETDMQLGMSGA